MKKVTASKVKVTFMVPQELWKEFQKLVPPGKRSQILSEAIKKRLEQIKVLKEIASHEKNPEVRKLASDYLKRLKSMGYIRRN